MGQGATEYLLILAAILVVVAVAVYYVTKVPGAPTIVVKVWVKPDNTVWIRGETGCTKTNWVFYYMKAGETAWHGPVTHDIGPGQWIQLPDLTGQVAPGDVVTLKWDTIVENYIVNRYTA